MKEYVVFGVGMIMEYNMKKRDLLSVLIEGMKLVISMYEICRTEKKKRR